MFTLPIALALCAVALAVVALVLAYRAQTAAEAEEQAIAQAEAEAAAAAAAEAAQTHKPAAKKALRHAAHPTHAPDDPLLLSVLKGHTGPVLHAVFTPDGKYLASCSDDRTIRLWHTHALASRDHTHLRCNVEYDHATSLAFSQDGHACVASLASANSIRIFKVSNKGISPVVDIHQNHDYKYGLLHNVAMAATAQYRYIVACFDKQAVEILHPKGELAERFDSGHNEQHFAAVSPCGRYFGISGFTPDVRLYAVTADNGHYTGKTKAMLLSGHTSGVYEFAFSLDSRRAATVSKDGTWRVHDIDVRWEQKEDSRRIASNRYTVASTKPHIAISHDGSVVAIGSGLTIEFFAAATGDLLYRIEHAHADGAYITAVCFDNASNYLATAGTDRHIRIWRNGPGLYEKIRLLKARFPNAATVAAKENIAEQIADAQKQLKEWGFNPAA